MDLVKRHNLLVTPYIERALRLTAHLKAQGTGKLEVWVTYVLASFD